jgi:hypothetical protein
MRVPLVLFCTCVAAVSLGAVFATGAPARDSAVSATLTVSAQANVYGAGRSTPPTPPGRSGPGKSPVLFTLPSGATTVRFAGGTGRVTCCTGLSPRPYSGPAGGSQLPGGTSITAFGGLSGVAIPDKQMFLVGVFLGAGAPGGNAPPTDTETRQPALAQIFYVGAGPRTVGIPAGATRLFLGFADGFGFNGAPGHYDDNEGSVQINVSTPGVAAPKPAGKLSLSLSRHRFVAAPKNVASCNGPSGQSSLECTVRHGAVLTLCNRDEYNHRPFSFTRFNVFGGPSAPVILRPGKCFKHRFLNPTKKPVVVKIYDEIHSQERFAVIVLPAGG